MIIEKSRSTPHHPARGVRIRGLVAGGGGRHLAMEYIPGIQQGGGWWWACGHIGLRQADARDLLYPLVCVMVVNLKKIKNICCVGVVVLAVLIWKKICTTYIGEAPVLFCLRVLSLTDGDKCRTETDSGRRCRSSPTNTTTSINVCKGRSMFSFKLCLQYDACWWWIVKSPPLERIDLLGDGEKEEDRPICCVLFAYFVQYYVFLVSTNSTKQHRYILDRAVSAPL